MPSSAMARHTIQLQGGAWTKTTFLLHQNDSIFIIVGTEHIGLDRHIPSWVRQRYRDVIPAPHGEMEQCRTAPKLEAEIWLLIKNP